MEELLIYGSQSEAVSTRPGLSKKPSPSIIQICDLHSGSVYHHNFKNVTLPRGSLNCAFHAGQERLFSTQHNSALLQVFSWGRESALQNIVVPEKLAVVAASPDGNWLVGGAFSGRLFVWEVMSGNLVAVRESHYQEVTVLEFSSDGTWIFTGSKDSTVLAWRMLDLVNSSTGMGASEGQTQPVYKWTKVHSLDITGLRIVRGHAKNVFSSSLDNTVRCWDLESGEIVSTYILPQKVTSLAIDPAERAIFCGLINGDIMMVHRYKVNNLTGAVEGPKGNNEKVVISYGEDSNAVVFARPDSDQSTVTVTSLELSFDGTILAAGYSDGHVYTWDIPTRQMGRKFAAQKESISSIQIISRVKKVTPGGHKATNLLAAKKNSQVGTSGEAFKLPFFKRIIDDKEMENHDLWVKIQNPAQNPEHEFDDIEKVKTQLNSLYSSLSTPKVSPALTTKLHQLEQELANAQKSYKDLKGSQS